MGDESPGVRNLAYREKAPIVAELASGAVVLPRGPPRVLLLHEREENRWSIPKGHVDPGESLEEAALREVREETGLRAPRLGPRLGEVSYEFFDPRRGTNVHKCVVYFLMTTRAVRVRPEAIFDEHRWVTFSEAQRMVHFALEREILRVASRKLALVPAG